MGYIGMCGCKGCNFKQVGRGQVEKLGNSSLEQGDIRHFQILRRGRLVFSRVNQRYLGGKKGQSSSFYYDYYEFQRESQWRKRVLKCQKFSHFAIERGLNFFKKYNKANFIDEKKYNEAFRNVYFLRIREESQLSYVQLHVLILESKGLNLAL